MSLNARLSQNDPRLYNPNRDIAHCFKGAMEEVADRLEAGRWKFLNDLLVEKGITQDQLGEAMEAAINFVAHSVDDKKEKMGECLARTGWWKVPELANVALCAYLGTVMMGMFWVGVHEATIQGEGPVSDVEDLKKAGRQAHALLATSGWRRRWLRLKARVKRAWSALFGKE